jgi:hypothetical protein
MYVPASSREEAEAQVLAESPALTVVDAREIDLSDADLPAHFLENTWWAVAFEGGDPDAPPDEDPLGEAERKLRYMMKSIATNPESLVTGEIEEFDCPTCRERIRLELPPTREVKAEAEREGRKTQEATCPKCGGTLSRIIGQLTWRSAG